MFTCDAIIEHSTVPKLQTKEGFVKEHKRLTTFSHLTSVLRSTLKFNAKPKGYCFVDFQKAVTGHLSDRTFVRTDICPNC